MYVICDNQNIVRNYANTARYVKAQSNGVTVLADSYRNSTAIYCEDDDTYWATKESIAGQKTYTMYQVAEVPEGAEVNITRYNNGSLEIDPELKAFAKVELEPGEERFVHLSLDEHAFAHYSTEKGAWVSFPGIYKIQVGASSRDIRLRKSYVIEGEKEPRQAESSLPHYWQGKVQAVPAGEFERLLGRPLPPERRDDWAPASYEDTISRNRSKGGLGRLVYSSLDIARKGLEAAGKRTASNNIQFIMDMPYNKLQRMSGGIVTQEAVEGYLDMLNGHVIKGGIKTIKALRKNKQK